ncbi:AMP-dependent synthetase and ligase [Methylorubrum populi BJ001]|jgi:propionyl-CoA synthetase|uniref:AMP-dependent synthetase and ligase n=1 Tax=Methylorubrum populi (strain ATCC BAA-705 / NCIMB 13946 / BJ001) TaxID=441620 RepID=B1ZJH3_METPB|nr:propionyl-CoA synthetase [Methylorubrum populi]ACB80076.1 AMP-dependent synthetase and ligase [Methylorubrum populi BJ001]OAH17081.1 propionate--CoA ligase [Methylorubrum populi]PZP68434.1 MAG: propionyl-CoA synthetase [Methylorubrum populi]
MSVVPPEGPYAALHAASLADREGFWLKAAAAIDWDAAPTRAFDPEPGVYGRWFPDARLNVCHNAVDRHAEGGRADQAAIIHDSPVTGTRRTITYGELRDEVAVLAGLLADLGVEKGDRVVIYMPMVPEALFGMLACARIGAIHSVVFGGFAANELAARIEDAAPKVILAASCGIEPARVVAYKPLLDAAIARSSHKPDACLILQRPQAEASLIEGRDRDWAQSVARARQAGRRAEPVPVAATDPLYILYTSGTTGRPKGVVRDSGGYCVALAWSMANLYGVAPGEVYFCASDIGWVVGHSYIVYAPLLHGCTTVLYEGKPVGTPDAGAFWRVVAEHGVCTLFTAPTALRAIKKEDPRAEQIAGYDLSRFRALFLAGERADPDSVAWAERALERPVIDHWWQTETGWAIAGNPIGIERLPVKYGSTAKPMPGYDLHVLDEAGKPVPAGTMGTIALKLPLPPGCLPTLWGSDERFRQSYLATFPGFYDTSDAGVVDADGYVTVLGRTDDIINVAGHRLSTGGMEAVLAAHPDVAECAVIGIRDSLKGEAPCGFVVLKAGTAKDPETIERELVARVREEIGPVAAFKLALTVGRLPKTRSGKILRGTMKRIADGEDFAMPPTIEDPATLEEIGDSLKARGIGG